MTRPQTVTFSHFSVKNGIKDECNTCDESQYSATGLVGPTRAPLHSIKQSPPLDLTNLVHWIWFLITAHRLLNADSIFGDDKYGLLWCWIFERWERERDSPEHRKYEKVSVFPCLDEYGSVEEGACWRWSIWWDPLWMGCVVHSHHGEDDQDHWCHLHDSNMLLCGWDV